MANITRNFTSGKMNKVVDERLIPQGEYIDAMNVRMGSTELNNIGAIENTKGNLALTKLGYIDGTQLSSEARTIGAFEDGANETIYWFVHDPAFTVGATGKLDLIMSYNTLTGILTYHVISIDNGDGVDTTLNFNEKYLITGVNKINNLLFFTDDYNQPRCIDVKKNYANPLGNVDQFTDESLLVIKRPPAESPEIQLSTVPGQENFLSERFICFAYRYRYANGEYSATSQFSEPAFIPQQFSFELSTFLNQGMTNEFNTATITYNAGGPLVVGIDLLFKEMDSNIIKVIEKLDKQELGLSDNTDYTYTFNNSKIYTVLPEYELLRLYDNVPRLAKAQTIMGNRLMYGNYLEGYDLLDKYGVPVKLNYSTALRTNEIGLTNLDTSLGEGDYLVDGSVTIVDSVAYIDLTGVSLSEGSLLNIDLSLTHSQFTGDTPAPTQQTNSIQLSLSFYLQESYSSVYDLATSVFFQNAIGTLSNIQTVANACNGTTLTDQFNCVMPNNLDSYIKYESGIAFTPQPIGIITSISSTEIGLQFPAVSYVDNTVSPTYTAYEYLKVSYVNASMQISANNQSLHSNRDYEIGIIYMDDYNRSTTTLVSPLNTVHVPCSNSVTKNSILVTIPSSPVAQIAPEWATRYKFVIKPSQENYETIYSSIFFRDPNSNNAYFLLEGENSKKVESGDKLIIKSDSSGAVTSCVNTTVLEKKAQAADFLSIPSSINPSVNIPIPEGVYMKINPNNFSAAFDEQSIIAPGLIEKTVDQTSLADYPWVSYPMNILDPGLSTYIDYTIPAGSRIVLSFSFEIPGGGNCDARTYTFERIITAATDYPNMYDFWIGQNIGDILNTGVGSTTSSCPINNVFNTPIISGMPAGINTGIGCLVNAYYYQFFRDPANNQLSLVVQGAPKCGNGYGHRRSSVSVNIQVFRQENIFVFETQPSEALPDVFYENNLSFPINANGEHGGNISSQNLALNIPAIVDTGFFNCFAFGNGVESYKTKDSLVGNSISLGNRVTTVAAQDYRAVRRFADITYSGVYNNESNVNKLNEFNLGLANFKPLEQSFGPIYIMDARQTDVLVLQEDKISYVLASKNLLSDAAAGGAITSVPEVLGTQIARTEKYGISFNPESYVQWGEDRFFTDVKRGAVLQLKGGESGMDSLAAISESGMSTWFRDLFNDDFNTQKLGAYDPYLDEYVLSSNNQLIPSVSECLSCGFTQEFTFTQEERLLEYCVDVGSLVGDVDITYNVVSIQPDVQFEIAADFDGNIFTTGSTSLGGTLTVDKDNNSVDVVNVQVSTTGPCVLEVTVNCPTSNQLTVVEVVITENGYQGYSIVPQWSYSTGTYTGSLQSSLLIFASGVNPIVSRFNSVSGFQGSANIPTNGSTVRMASNKLFPTNFNFDPSQNKFRYLRTDTVYDNNTVDINTLVAASSVGSISGAGTYYYSDIPAGTTGDFLYLIWDLRTVTEVGLCWSADVLDVDYVCCECNPCDDPCKEWSLQNVGSGSAVVNYINCSGVSSSVTIPEGQTQIICSIASDTPSVISGGVVVTVSQECGCKN